MRCKYYITGLFAALLLLCSTQRAEAADCGTKARPSQRSGCTCKSTLVKGKLRFTRRRSASACWKKAAKAAKARCVRGASQAIFRWKKGLLTRRSCTITYQCAKPLRRKRGTKLLPKRYLRRGTKLVRFKYRIGRRRRPCAAAAKRLRRKVCGRSKGVHPLRFTSRKTGYRVKFIMGFKKGRCKIAWRCWYKKKKTVYWCE